MTKITNSGTNDGVLVGINNGTVTTEIHLPQRPETPPSPLSTVPFKRDADFVSRDRFLDQIHEKSSIPGSRIALVGLGGVGKSQIAIEYSYRVRSESPETWVFWVHASNAARFEQSFRDIAEQVKIPNRQDSKIDVFKLVENWLRDEKRGKWILILDNVDDDDLFHKHPAMGNATTKPLLQYLPTSLPGYIIVTSRSKEVALKIVDYRDLVEVLPMDKSEGLELLQRKLGSGDNEDSRQLVQELEFMPLAIVQAAGYIRKRAPRYSVSRYLTEFRKSDREATNLLKQEGDSLYRDWEASNSILVTWQMSFEHIRRNKPSAADLLSLMCFFDRQGIPEYLLRFQDENDRVLDGHSTIDSNEDGEVSKSDMHDDFENDIVTLRDYSFVSIVEDGAMFTMHRLVQLTTRIWLKTHGNMEKWTERFINNLYNEFPNGRYETWEKCRSLFPHVKLAMSQQTELLALRPRQNWAAILYKGAHYALATGNTVDMIEMAKKSRKERIDLRGAEDEDYLASTEILALAYEVKGQWERAEELHLPVMEIRKKILGEDHRGTLNSMGYLASAFRHQGRYQEAERLNLQVMKISKTKLGKDHPDTLTSMGNLASIFMHQGRYKEAERLELQVMETRKTMLGEDHPDTLVSMCSLASISMHQGRYQEAERLNVQVMKIRKTKLGEDHPNTLISMNNLASMFMLQGRYQEAERLNMQVMEKRKMILGVDHPDTLIGMGNLASIFTHQGRYQEAERLNVQVMKIRKKMLGEDHPDTLIGMGNLASIFMHQGRYKEAERLELQVMETRKTILGEDHPKTLISMGSLALIFMHQGRYQEAERLNMQVMETRKTILGEDHPNTLISMNNLASIFMLQSRYKEAERLNVQVMEKRKTTLGEDHPHTLQSMVNLSITWKSLGPTSNAIDLLQDCLARQERIMGIDHPDTVSTSRTLLEWTSKSLGDSS